MEQLGRIAEIARRYRIPVLSDEIYKRFLYEGEFASITRFPGMKDLAIILDGFSKSYAMTGWRLGYGVMPMPLAEHVTRLMVNSNSCTRLLHPAWRASPRCRATRRRWPTMVAEFKRRRDLLVAGLNRLPGVSCRSPRGAFYVFPNIKALKRPSSEVAEALLQEAGVAVLGGTAFGEYGEGYLRLSYANSEANLRKALERMRPVLARLAGGVAGPLGAHRRRADRRGPAAGPEVPRLFGVPGGGSNLELLEAARAQRPALRALPPGVGRRASWPPSPASSRAGRARCCPRSAPASPRAPPAWPTRCLDRAPLIYLSDRHPAGALALRHASVPRPRGAPRARREGQRDASTPDSAGHWVAHAVQLALAEPRGPVHLDLPADVAGAAGACRSADRDDAAGAAGARRRRSRARRRR